MATFNRDLKSGKVYMHQFIDGARFRVSTGIVVAEKDWSGYKAKNNMTTCNNVSVNSQLMDLQSKLQVAIARLTSTGGDIS
jgi:hypothetical protein